MTMRHYGDRSMAGEVVGAVVEAAWYVASEAVGLAVAGAVAMIAAPPILAIVVWDRWQARASREALKRRTSAAGHTARG